MELFLRGVYLGLIKVTGLLTLSQTNDPLNPTLLAAVPSDSQTFGLQHKAVAPTGRICVIHVS